MNMFKKNSTFIQFRSAKDFENYPTLDNVLRVPNYSNKLGVVVDWSCLNKKIDTFQVCELCNK